jgi:hypothetical protein
MKGTFMQYRKGYSSGLQHYTRQANHYHVVVDWRVCAVVLVGLLACLFILKSAWKVATADYCPAYYGTNCSLTTNR